MRPHYFDFHKYQPRGPYRYADRCSPCAQWLELLQAVPELLRLWRKRVRERDELARLNPAMRRDIGVAPSEIAAECSKPFWRA